MKKILSVLGGIFLFLVVVIACFFGFAAFQGQGLDNSSREYIEVNVPPILATWSKNELLKRSSPQLLKTVNEHPELFNKFFQKLTKLGALQSFGDIKGDSTASYTTQQGKEITASYVSNARFQNGEAKIIIRLIQSPEGKWQFLQFNVNSPIFLQ